MPFSRWMWVVLLGWGLGITSSFADFTLSQNQAPGNSAIPAQFHEATQALTREDYYSALDALTNINTGELSPDDHAHYETLRAETFLGLHHDAEALDAYLQQLPWLHNAKTKEKAVRHIWHMVQHWPDEKTPNTSLTTEHSPQANSWFELHTITREYEKNKDQKKALQELSLWQAHYVNHPALPWLATLLPSDLQKNSEETSTLANVQQSGGLKSEGGTPLHMAVLLPQQGLWQDATNAITQGMMFAYFHGVDRKRVDLRFYDTADHDAEGIQHLYHQAIEDGANVVIGPLEKSALYELWGNKTFHVPTLLLNDDPSLVPTLPNAYRFSLAKENEMDTLAAALKKLPANPVWIIHDLHGERMAQSLHRLLENPTEKRPITTTFINPQQTLPTQLSDDLRLQRERLPGTLVLLTNQQTAEAVGTWLRAQTELSASHWYGSSLLLDHWPPHTARALDGIRFADIPWFFEPEEHSAQSIQRLCRAFPKQKPSWLRLAAFGYDAIALAEQIKTSQANLSTSLRGRTGILHWDEQHRLQRELSWVVIKEGRMQLEKSL